MGIRAPLPPLRQRQRKALASYVLRLLIYRLPPFISTFSLYLYLSAIFEAIMKGSVALAIYEGPNFSVA